MTLTCNATGNPEPKTFSWNIDGSAVNTSVNPRISLSSNNKELTITNVSRKDSGEYKCDATNSVGTTCSRVAKLDVQCKCILILRLFQCYGAVKSWERVLKDEVISVGEGGSVS